MQGSVGKQHGPEAAARRRERGDVLRLLGALHPTFACCALQPVRVLILNGSAGQSYLQKGRLLSAMA